MVSIRCKMAVKAELDKLELKYGTIDLGEVDVESIISGMQMDQLKVGLLKSGLSLMEDRKAVLIEKIKDVIIYMVHYAEDLPKTKSSIYISKKLNHDYNSVYFSALFFNIWQPPKIS